jgi:hypothetical protein
MRSVGGVAGQPRDRNCELHAEVRIDGEDQIDRLRNDVLHLSVLRAGATHRVDTIGVVREVVGAPLLLTPMRMNLVAIPRPESRR